MGKTRRAAKLERRNLQEVVAKQNKFDWKKVFRRMALITPRVLLVVFGMLLIQMAGAAAGIKFLSTPIGQLTVFGVAYIGLFRWIYAPMLAEQKVAREQADRAGLKQI